LVHEAYLRLAGSNNEVWESPGHFFGAAAEAMRRILVDNARRKRALAAGGNRLRVHLDDIELTGPTAEQDVLALEEALGELERHDHQAAALVKLRFFAGLSHTQAAEALGISRRAADRIWKIARAWLQARLTDSR
jgi:RNA polymerase sigma factor (TIGR02999 family)